MSGCAAASSAVCGNGVLDSAEDCEFGDLDGETCTSQLGVEAVGTLACTAGACTFDTSGCQARYEEQNVGGEPTVVDHATGLEWVVTNDSGSGLLDKDNKYTWSTGTNYADGTAFITYISGLNFGAYGGHADWRLPSAGGCCGVGPFKPAELESIADCSFGVPCIDQTLFGPTASNSLSWSSSTVASDPLSAWLVNFANGFVGGIHKTGNASVRAVRGGLWPCGDGIAQAGEQCDGADLGGATCDSVIANTSGTLACTLGCQYEVSGCAAAGPAVCGNGVLDSAEDCEFGDLDGETCTSQLGVEAVGTLACTAGACTFDTSGCQARYEEQNVGGEPTVVDHATGLEWVVTNDSGSGLLDKDNVYTWSTLSDADGTAFTVYIAGLNGGAYGGHADWRLPSSGGIFGLGPYEPAELESILDCSFGVPCIDQTLFGPTASDIYWSSSTSTGFAGGAFFVNFNNGFVTNDFKTNARRVRAVRGGL